VTIYDVFYLEWDDDNEWKFDLHGVDVGDVEDMIFDDDPYRIPNKRPHPLERLRIVGTNREGRPFVAILAPTTQRGEWRPGSGWWLTGNDHELTLYHNRKARRR
jgi:uncharacterized DUF497 family protein